MSNIILIGPARTGKSTLAQLLSERLGLKRVSLDDLRWEYYREIGYSDELARQIRAAGGFVALVFYWKQFDVHALERVLADYENTVIDLGAGHSVYESTEFLERARTALQDQPDVILILPSPDANTSIEILNERTKDLVGSFGQGFNWNAYFVRQPSNGLLAKHTVYTQDRTPQETCEEIIQLIRK